MHRLRRFFDLPPGDRVLLVRALGWVALTRVGLWLVSFRRLRAAADRVGVARPAGRRADPARTAWAVETVARAVPRATCLTQALAADAMLRRAGRSPVVRFGVTKDGGAIQAHAWVELDGLVLVGDHDLDRFVPLAGGEV